MNVSPGLNTFNAVANLDGPSRGVEQMLLDDKQRYDITFVQVGDKLVARTVNHPEGAAGTIDFVKADKGYEFDFELSSVVIDASPDISDGGLRFTFYDYNYDGGAGREFAGPVFDLSATLKPTSVIDGVDSRTVKMSIDRQDTSQGAPGALATYNYPYGGQRRALVAMILGAIAAAEPIKLRLNASVGDDQNGFSIKKV